LKLELSSDELYLLKASIENVQIKGVDAPRVAKLLERLTTAFKKQVEKDNGPK
tara:strand:+ start:1936 stop:2094 length:159 start_codon:yes stop_codon:yes gene_type:complete